MKVIPVRSKNDLKAFYYIEKEVYKNNPYHRSTNDDIIKLIIEGPTAFHSHASVNPFIIIQDQKPVGRYALIYDQKLPDYIQVSFFEALPGLSDLADNILNQAQILHPQCKRIVIGLNGHLNYGVGLLLSRFEESPVFGLPYTPAYYQDYFRDFKKRKMVSYRFPTKPFFEFIKNLDDNLNLAGITVRKMNKKKLQREIEIYTYLNNACFSEHPFWADRSVEEDYELFYPFRWLLREEYFLFAEYEGKPIGFLLWYPDFNELVTGNHHLRLHHVLHHRFQDPIKTFRFTQIAVLPQYRISTATLALILEMIPSIQKAGYQYGEGGFIFEENINSMTMTRRFLERGTGCKIEPYRHYAIFESSL